MDLKYITLTKYGTAMHLTPSGDEGYLYTVEQVYDQLINAKPKQQQGQNQSGSASGGDGAKDDRNSDGEDKADGGKGGGKDQDNEKEKGEGKAGGGQGGGKSKGKTEKCSGEGGNGDGDISDAQLDALVDKLLAGRAVHGKIDPNTKIDTNVDTDTENQGKVDDHSFWNGDAEDNINRDVWLERMVEATDIVAQSDGKKGRGITPLAAEREVSALKNPSLDWRTILNDFVQEEINDYSFSPPDKRMEDSPFFLPDFNEKDECVKDILFMVDTSASMSEDDVTECYSEIYGAIQQFDGRLSGKLGFFDATVVEPIPFEDEEEFKIIRAMGGGGTSFAVIFDYVRNKMQDDPPVSIIILTDGYAPFPNEKAADGIPVLWVINNRAVKPPWGKLAVIERDK